jgi:UDP-N-acetyl-D-glucosamine dehydrogenase
LIVLESTTYPGTTEEVVRPVLEAGGLIAGRDFHLAFSPERIDPGNPVYGMKNTPKVGGGTTPGCTDVAAYFYGKFVDTVVRAAGTREAEMAKLLENTYRHINIALVNEMARFCNELDIDLWDVINCAKSKPFGFQAFYPGPGVGGHCIPIDPFYLTWKAREYGLSTHFIELAGEINRDMPEWVVSKVADALNERQKSLKGSRILALGIAYKRDVDDMRESPSVFVMEHLRDRGAIVAYSDPNVPEFPKMREHHFDLSSVQLTAENIAVFDAVVLLTDHSDFDYDLILKNAQLIVDTRGKFRDPNPVVVKA